MDPSMAMGGGMPPGMDPMMAMQQGMGGAPPPGGIDPSTGKPVKLKMEEVLMKETGRIKEMLNAMFQFFDIPIPPSVVDPSEMSRAILEQQKRDSQKQQVDDSMPGNPRVNPIEGLLAESNKIGSFAEAIAANKEKLAAIQRFLTSRQSLKAV
jgi:hypothetical protein